MSSRSWPTTWIPWWGKSSIWKSWAGFKRLNSQEMPKRTMKVKRTTVSYRKIRTFHKSKKTRRLLWRFSCMVSNLMKTTAIIKKITKCNLSSFWCLISSRTKSCSMSRSRKFGELWRETTTGQQYVSQKTSVINQTKKKTQKSSIGMSFKSSLATDPASLILLKRKMPIIRSNPLWLTMTQMTQMTQRNRWSSIGLRA